MYKDNKVYKHLLETKADKIGDCHILDLTIPNIDNSKILLLHYPNLEKISILYLEDGFLFSSSITPFIDFVTMGGVKNKLTDFKMSNFLFDNKSGNSTEKLTLSEFEYHLSNLKIITENFINTVKENEFTRMYFLLNLSDKTYNEVISMLPKQTRYCIFL